MARHAQAQVGPRLGQRRKDRVQPHPPGQHPVDPRLRLVQPSTSQPSQPCRQRPGGPGVQPHPGVLHSSTAVDPHRAVPVDEDIGHRSPCDPRLQRPEAQHLLPQPRALARGPFSPELDHRARDVRDHRRIRSPARADCLLDAGPPPAAGRSCRPHPSSSSEVEHHAIRAVPQRSSQPRPLPSLPVAAHPRVAAQVRQVRGTQVLQHLVELGPEVHPTNASPARPPSRTGHRPTTSVSAS